MALPNGAGGCGLAGMQVPPPAMKQPFGGAMFPGGALGASTVLPRPTMMQQPLPMPGQGGLVGMPPVGGPGMPPMAGYPGMAPMAGVPPFSAPAPMTMPLAAPGQFAGGCPCPGITPSEGPVAQAAAALQSATASVAQAAAALETATANKAQALAGMPGQAGVGRKDQAKPMPAFRSSFVTGRPSNRGGEAGMDGFDMGFAEMPPPANGGISTLPPPAPGMPTSLSAPAPMQQVAPAAPAQFSVPAPSPGGYAPVPAMPPPVAPEASLRSAAEAARRIEESLETFLGSLPVWRGGQRDVCRAVSESPERGKKAGRSRSGQRQRRPSPVAVVRRGTGFDVGDPKKPTQEASRSRSKAKKKEKKEKKEKHREKESRSPSRTKKKKDKDRDDARSESRGKKKKKS
eukprot:TRINITY_DN62756_c1_g1_i1.p1 TRINITY_DN62756_c1_g1~~TRINITY_DN62756_c1_g1_i1.p1  ORF type:complete len:423 (+),score=90.87 TRINITY_DN62756_c1_g1_i1:64-1269(+)